MVYQCGFHGHHFRLSYEGIIRHLARKVQPQAFGSNIKTVESTWELHRLHLVQQDKVWLCWFCMFSLAEQREKKEAQMITSGTTQPRVHHRSQCRPSFSQCSSSSSSSSQTLLSNSAERCRPPLLFWIIPLISYVVFVVRLTLHWVDKKHSKEIWLGDEENSFTWV